MLTMLLYIILLQCVYSCLAGDLPKYFPRCHIDDPNLNQCLVKATETVRPFIQKGIPELDIPSLDPLVIPKLTLQQGTNAVNYKVTLTNATIQGMGDYVFEIYEYDTKNLTSHATASFKSLKLVSDYNIDGKILVAEVKGKGVLTSVLGPSTGTLDVKGELVTRNGKQYYNPIDVKATIKISNVTGQFDGLFNGNKELSRATNQLLRDNSKELIEEIRPVMEKVAEELLMKMLLGINRNVPYIKLLPPST